MPIGRRWLVGVYTTPTQDHYRQSSPSPLSVNNHQKIGHNDGYIPPQCKGCRHLRRPRQRGKRRRCRRADPITRECARPCVCACLQYSVCNSCNSCSSTVTNLLQCERAYSPFLPQNCVLRAACFGFMAAKTGAAAALSLAQMASSPPTIASTPTSG